ncbi:hypothetical protein BH23ACT10_BH23ACT10_07740 [soil metagenome]
MTRCAECDGEAARIYSAPMTAGTSGPAATAIERAEKTRHEPDVVTSLPPRRGARRVPTAPPNPALRKLPRP